LQALSVKREKKRTEKTPKLRREYLKMLEYKKYKFRFVHKHLFIAYILSVEHWYLQNGVTNFKEKKLPSSEPKLITFKSLCFVYQP